MASKHIGSLLIVTDDTEGTMGDAATLVSVLQDTGFDLTACGSDINGTLADVTSCFQKVVGQQAAMTSELLSDIAANLDMFFLVLIGIIIYRK